MNREIDLYRGCENRTPFFMTKILHSHNIGYPAFCREIAANDLKVERIFIDRNHKTPLMMGI